MITLYTWLPPLPSALIENSIPPDLGHSAMAIDAADDSRTYVSFWPDLESVIGRLTLPLKPRTERHPESYQVECDHAQPYMQRPADFIETIDGLNEAHIAAGWASIRDLPYDLKSWNCAHVNRLLILSSLNPEQLGPAIKVCDFKIMDFSNKPDLDQIRATVVELAEARLFGTTPTDVRRLMQSLGAVEVPTTVEPRAEPQVTTTPLQPAPSS